MFEHFDLAQLLSSYGYPALFIGCLLEGETILILAGLAAHQGLLAYAPVVMWATLAGTLGDQLLYWAGRRSGDRAVPWLRRRGLAIERVTGLIERHPLLAIFSVRFLYGMRLAGPLLIGASRVGPLRFLLINLLGAFCWALLFASAGYWAGEVLERWLGNLRPYRLPIFLTVLVLVGGLELWRRCRQRRKTHSPASRERLHRP
ncbi:DedA family protein [Pseudomonas denitrificans (nom. rej.)]|nr:DedA family protein [Pseudomonas denitrificans (nom. rej.)]